MGLTTYCGLKVSLPIRYDSNKLVVNRNRNHKRGLMTKSKKSYTCPTLKRSRNPKRKEN